MPNEKMTPVFKMPPEMRTRLTTLKEDVDRAKSGIEVMKKIGMSTKELEDKLNWAEETRKTLLKEFG